MGKTLGLLRNVTDDDYQFRPPDLKTNNTCTIQLSQTTTTTTTTFRLLILLPPLDYYYYYHL